MVKRVVGSETGGIPPLPAPERPPAKGVADPTTSPDWCTRCDSTNTHVLAVQGDDWQVACYSCGAVWLTPTLEGS